MSIRRTLQHMIVLSYCCITFLGALFSFTKHNILLPWPIVRFSYGMMAPYQGYTTTNSDLLAEGRRSDGTWVHIDLAPYYPMIRGNQIMYRRLRSFLAAGEEVHQRKYRELAKLLLEREKQHERSYSAVRLTWQEWPVSPNGWDALRTDAHTTNYPITQVSK